MSLVQGRISCEGRNCIKNRALFTFELSRTRSLGPTQRLRLSKVLFSFKENNNVNNDNDGQKYNENDDDDDDDDDVKDENEDDNDDDDDDDEVHLSFSIGHRNGEEKFNAVRLFRHYSQNLICILH